MRTIFISKGHNAARNSPLMPKDYGASSGGETEFKYVQKVADEIVKKPVANLKIVVVPEGLNLKQRVKWINALAKDGDVAIELHMDSAASIASGCMTFYYGGSAYAMRKAREFQMEYTKVTGLRGRGVRGDTESRFGRLGFIRDTKPVAFLLEMGFLTNEDDRDKVWVHAARGVVEAIAKTFKGTPM